MKWISITTFYFCLFFEREEGGRDGAFFSNGNSASILICDEAVNVHSDHDLHSWQISIDFSLRIPHFCPSIQVTTLNSSWSFWLLFLTAVLYFLIYLQTCGFLKFFCDQKKKELKKNASLGMYTYPIWDAHGIFLRVPCFIQSSWRLISHGGYSPVWFLRYDDLDYGWHRNAWLKF